MKTHGWRRQARVEKRVPPSEEDAPVTVAKRLKWLGEVATSSLIRPGKGGDQMAQMAGVDWPHGWATTQPPSQEPFVRNPYGWCMNRPCHKGMSQVCLRIPLSFEQAWWEGSFDLDISRRSQGQIVLPDFVEHRLQGNPNGHLQMQTRG